MIAVRARTGASQNVPASMAAVRSARLAASAGYVR